MIHIVLYIGLNIVSVSGPVTSCNAVPAVQHIMINRKTDRHAPPVRVVCQATV